MAILNLEKPLSEKTILLTTNFTKSAHNAINFAINLFGDKSVKYVIMNSYYEPPMTHDALHSVEEMTERASHEKCVAEMERIQSSFPELDLNIICESVYGLLKAAINESVEKYKVDYVVIGNKSSFDLESRLLGYKAANFIRKINCPVIAIPEDIKFSDMKEITFASDMKSINNMEVLEPALEVIKRHEAKLNILYVSKDEEVLVGQQAESGLYLDNYFAEIPHEFHHSSNPFIIAGISRFVESSNSSLVILLARKQKFFKRLIEGSKTQMMSELAKIPVLVLHE